MTQHVLVTVGPLLAIIGVLLACTVLGWEPALAWITRPAPERDRFTFTPRVISPVLLLSILIVGAATIILLSVWAMWVSLLVATPLLLLALGRLAITLGRTRYRQRLAEQVLLAVNQLAALTSGQASLLSAFRIVAQSSAWPLSEEWAWVDRHLNVAYQVDDYGRTQTRYSDHAYALRRLAEQTPLELHARVLDHLAAIYEAGAESHAPSRLRQLAELLTEQDRLRRELALQFGRVRGEAFIISGAIGLIALWLLISQTERVWMAFVGSPFGPIAALWFLFWLVLPLFAGIVLTRTRELPL